MPTPKARKSSKWTWNTSSARKSSSPKSTPSCVRPSVASKPYVYTLVRKDIPLADQLVQFGHACLEAGSAFYRPSHGTTVESDGQIRHEREVASLIGLQVPDQDALIRASEELTQAGIRHEIFFEPDDGMGYTALTTEPISGKMREAFKKFPLWK